MPALMMAIPIQLRLRLRIDSWSPHLSSLQLLIASFSSTSYTNPRVSNSFFDDEVEGQSSVYKHKLNFQRPSSVRWRREFRNSASFIGTVVQPLKSLKDGGVPLAYTVLRVRNSPHSNESFRILVHMRNKMAELCLKHLKGNDFIFISGQLETKAKIDQNGNLRLLYKVEVKELNYVTGGNDTTSQSNSESQSVEGGMTILEKYRTRLHLWQVFFSSPYEWWDNRESKKNPNHPDFKHKDTGEALWLSPNDPPWVMKQLKLIDSSMAVERKSEPPGRRVHLSKWEFDP